VNFGWSGASLMLIVVFLEAGEDLPNILRWSQISQGIETELWYLSRNKGVSFS
jgi:hypothetical protein